MARQLQTGKILIVDDESAIRKFLSISLAVHGYVVIEAENGQKALESAVLNKPDIVVLDLGLPDMDGKAVIKKIREWADIPILVLSVRTDEQEKVAALDSGANDYVTKPFGIAELLARLRALARIHKMETGQITESIFNKGGLKIDYALRIVEINGQPVKLTQKEYELLRILTRNAGKVLTHDFLLQQVWGPSVTNQTQHLRVHMGNLRQKLNDDPANPVFILTEPKVGYRFIA